MSAATFYAQINLASVTSGDAVPSGQAGLLAKTDGLYAKLPSASDYRLLTTDDIGRTVAAYSHTHNYDNYQYWALSVDGGLASQIQSTNTLSVSGGTGISLGWNGTSKSLGISISDDVVRKSGVPYQYGIPVWYNSNTLVADSAFWYNYNDRILCLGESISNLSTTLKSYCHSTTASESNLLLAIRSNNAGAILTGTDILIIRANGYYMSAANATVGELKFTAAEDFYTSNTGSTYSLSTFTTGGGSLALRHFITGVGYTRIGGRLIAGTTSTDPSSILQTVGSFAANITTVSANVTLDNSHFTLIITGTAIITFPAASSCTGRIYVIVNKSGASRTTSSYLNLSGTAVTSVATATSLWIQSNGTNWHQIK